MQQNMSGSLRGAIDEMLSGSVAGNISLNSGGGGSNVTITPALSEGTKVADYTIDGSEGVLYAPTPTEYTAGDNISISTEGIISATYTAGDNVSIEDGVISARTGESLTYKDGYILFTDGFKNNFIDTLLPQLDLEYYIDFYINEYQNDKAILGNDGGADRVHLTMYNNMWFSSNGSGEFSFGDSTMITGRHTFKWNESGTHKILFDNVQVGTCNQSISDTLSIRLNNRAGIMCCAGSRIYEFKVTNHQGIVLHDFKPYVIYSGNRIVDKRVIDIVGGMNVGAGYYEIVEIDNP